MNPCSSIADHSSTAARYDEQQPYHHSPSKLEYLNHFFYNNKGPSATSKTNNTIMFLDSPSSTTSTKATHSSTSSTHSNSSTSTKVIDNYSSSVKFSSTSVANSNVNHPLLLRRRTSSLSSTTTTASTTTTQRSDGIQNPFRDDQFLQHQHNSNDISSRHVLQGAGAGAGAGISLSDERLWIMQPSIATNNDERMEECCCSSTSAVTTKTTTSHAKKRDLSNSSSSDCQNNGSNNDNNVDDGDDDLLLLDCAALGSSLKRIKLSPTKSPGELRLSNDLQQLLKDKNSDWMIYHIPDHNEGNCLFETSQKEWQWICNTNQTIFMARDPVDALRLRIIMFVVMDDREQPQPHSKWCFWMQFPKMYPHSPPVVYQMTIMEEEEETNKQCPLSSTSSLSLSSSFMMPTTTTMSANHCSTTSSTTTTNFELEAEPADYHLITQLNKLECIKPPKYGQIHVQQETLPYHHHHHHHHHHHSQQQRRQIQGTTAVETNTLAAGTDHKSTTRNNNNKNTVCYKYQNWSPIRRLEDLLHWLWTLPGTNPNDGHGSSDSSSTSTDLMMMD